MNAPRPRLILAFDGGGLCNRIFPFANAIAASVEYGWQIVNPVFAPYAGYFLGSTGDEGWKQKAIVSNHISPPQLHLAFWRQRLAISRRVRSRAVITGGDHSPIDLDLLPTNLVSMRTVWLCGLYCLAERAFRKHADTVRSYFAPIGDIQTIVQDHVREARKGADVLVGVHIRQGDYLQHDGGMLYYETDEFADLMREMRDAMSGRKVRFLVCSNVVQSGESLNGLDWIPGPGTEIGDLYCLAACDFIIGPPSTYSQWASFYGEVPRFVHNRKYDERSGLPRTALSCAIFSVHTSGFGRFCGG